MSTFTEIVHDALVAKRKKELDAEAATAREAMAKERAEVDARAAAVQAELEAKAKELTQIERDARLADLQAREREIASARAAKNKRALSPNELRIRAIRSLAKTGAK